MSDQETINALTGQNKRVIDASASFQGKARNRKFTQPMRPDATSIFAQVLMSDMGMAGKPSPLLREVPEAERTFLMNVLMKRIDVLKLPISFTLTGALAAEALAHGNVGSIVVILIDCLTAYEGKTVNAQLIADLYPWGFYNDETFTDYIDNYLKPRKVKWANIY